MSKSGHFGQVWDSLHVVSMGPSHLCTVLNLIQLHYKPGESIIPRIM